MYPDGIQWLKTVEQGELKIYSPTDSKYRA